MYFSGKWGECQDVEIVTDSICEFSGDSGIMFVCFDLIRYIPLI